MMFSADWKRSTPHLAKSQDIGKSAQEVPTSGSQNATNDPSMFRSFLGSCGGFMETAVLLLGPSDCISCFDESLRQTQSNRPSRSMKRQGSARARLKLAQKLKDSPSREGEVVDVPIKLVKSRSGKATKDETGQVYDPYRSFDDSISAISAHTLDEMARKYPKPLMASLNGGKSRPRNGDELAAPPAQRISSDSSDDSGGVREQTNPDDEIDNDIPFRTDFDKPVKDKRTTYELIENDIPFVMTRPKRRKNTGRNGSRSSTRKSYEPVDAHLAPTPKARGRKSKRRSSKLEPQVAEI